MIDDILYQRINSVLNTAKISLLELKESCQEIVLFGSFGTEYEHDKSDLDLLCIGSQKSIKNKRIDIVCQDPRNLKLDSWLGSELANHISKYGRWIKGTGDWKNSTFISESSITQKELQILNKLNVIWIKRDRLDENKLIAYYNKVALDVIRLAYLYNKEPVPPTDLIINLPDEKKDLLYHLALDSSNASKVIRTYIC